MELHHNLGALLSKMEIIKIMESLANSVDSDEILASDQVEYLRKIADDFSRLDLGCLQFSDLDYIFRGSVNLLVVLDDKVLTSSLQDVVRILKFLAKCLECSQEPKETEELLASLLEILFSRFSRAPPLVKDALIGQVVLDFIKLSFDQKLPITLMRDVIKAVNLILQKSTAEIRRTFVKKNGSVIQTLASHIRQSGDYDTQVSIVEALYRFTFNEDRHILAQKWFPKNISQKFAKISKQDFECDARIFINTFNESMGNQRSVFSLPCQELLVGETRLQKPQDSGYQEFWVDFNIGTKSMSVVCVIDGHSDGQWESLYVTAPDVSEIMVKNLCGVQELLLQVSNSCTNLFCSISMSPYPGLRIKAIFGVQSDLRFIIEKIFPGTLKHPVSDSSQEMYLPSQVQTIQRRRKSSSASCGIPIPAPKKALALKASESKNVMRLSKQETYASTKEKRISKKKASSLIKGAIVTLDESQSQTLTGLKPSNSRPTRIPSPDEDDSSSAKESDDQEAEELNQDLRAKRIISKKTISSPKVQCPIRDGAGVSKVEILPKKNSRTEKAIQSEMEERSEVPNEPSTNVSDASSDSEASNESRKPARGKGLQSKIPVLVKNNKTAIVVEKAYDDQRKNGKNTESKHISPAGMTKNSSTPGKKRAKPQQGGSADDDDLKDDDHEKVNKDLRAKQKLDEKPSSSPKAQLSMDDTEASVVDATPQKKSRMEPFKMNVKEVRNEVQSKPSPVASDISSMSDVSRESRRSSKGKRLFTNKSDYLDDDATNLTQKELTALENSAKSPSFDQAYGNKIKFGKITESTPISPKSRKCGTSTSKRVKAKTQRGKSKEVCQTPKVPDQPMESQGFQVTDVSPIQQVALSMFTSPGPSKSNPKAKKYGRQTGPKFFKRHQKRDEIGGDGDSQSVSMLKELRPRKREVNYCEVPSFSDESEDEDGLSVSKVSKGNSQHSVYSDFDTSSSDDKTEDVRKRKLTTSYRKKCYSPLFGDSSAVPSKSSSNSPRPKTYGRKSTLSSVKIRGFAKQRPKSVTEAVTVYGDILNDGLPDNTSAASGASVHKSCIRRKRDSGKNLSVSFPSDETIEKIRNLTPKECDRSFLRHDVETTEANLEESPEVGMTKAHEVNIENEEPYQEQHEDHLSVDPLDKPSLRASPLKGIDTNVDVTPRTSRPRSPPIRQRKPVQERSQTSEIDEVMKAEIIKETSEIVLKQVLAPLLGALSRGFCNIEKDLRSLMDQNFNH